MTPYWFHVFFMRHVRGVKSAGTPGHGPYPTYFDRVVSLKGIDEYCRDRGLVAREIYSAGHGRRGNTAFKLATATATWALHVLSLGRLTARHPDLIFVIEKPDSRRAAS